MATEANFIFYRAEDIALVFTLRQSNGVTAQDITGWTLAFRAGTAQYGSPTITKTPTLTDPNKGIFTVNLASADTSALTQEGTDGLYYYDIRRTDTGSRFELFYGTLTVKDTATNG